MESKKSLRAGEIIFNYVFSKTFQYFQTSREKNHQDITTKQIELSDISWKFSG